MWNNTPLQNLCLALKHGTVHFSVAYAIALALFGLVAAGSHALVGFMILVHAGFVYWCGQSIQLSLQQESKARRMAASSDKS